MGSFQGVNYLIPIIVIPILLGRIGIENYGIISVAQAVAHLLAVIGDYGLNLTGTKLFSQDNEKVNHHKFIGQILLGKVLLWLLLSFIFFLLTLVIPAWKENQVALLLTLSISFGHTLLPVWYFQGTQKMGTFAILMISSKVIYLGGILLFVQQPQDFIWVNLINGLSLTFFAVVGLVVALSRTKIKVKFSLRETISLMKSNTTIFLSISAGTFYRNVPLITAGFILTEFNLGIYSIIDKIIQLISNTYGVIFRALYPIVCQQVLGGTAALRKFMLSTFKPLVIASLLSSLIILVWGADLLHWVDEQLNLLILANLMPWLAMIPVLVLINVVLSLLMLAQNQNKAYLYFHVLAIASVCIIAPFSRLFGIQALIISFVIAEISMTLYGTFALLNRTTRVS